jgi:hypothetical protein
MRVRAIRDCFVGHHWRQGEEGEYEGPKNKHLETVKTAKPEVVKAVKALKPEPFELSNPEPAKEEAQAEAVNEQA